MLQRCRAFTLLELAAVLVIVSLMTGFGLQVFQTTGGMDCYASTEDQLKTINHAFETFATKQKRLPKPSYPGLGSGDPGFGAEASDGPDGDTLPDDPTVAAYGTMVPSGMSNAGGVLIGALPHSDLGLSIDYASDCWGNKFTYAVTNSLTSSDSAAGYPASSAEGAITLNGGTIAAPVLMSDKVDYLVISHGMNKFGATPMSHGNRAAGNCNGTAGTIIDKENCDTTNATFFNSVRNTGSGAVDYFDDIVVFGKNLAKGGGGDTNLYCWGTDFSGYGVMADNSTTVGHYSYVPLKSQSTTEFTQFAEALPNNTSGPSTGCALTCDGTAYCWGRNDSGQIGDGTLVDKPVPTAVDTSVKFAKLYMTGYSPTVCGLQRNADGTIEGTTYCWGYNSGGRAGIGALTPIRVMTPTAVSTAQKFKQLAAKNDTICGLAMNSSVYCWSGSMVDRAGVPANNETLPVQIAGNRKFGSIQGGVLFCGITNGLDPLGAGKIYCWGSSRNLNDKGIFLSDPVSISAITRANPAVITTAAPHTLNLYDQFVVRRTDGMGRISIMGTGPSGGSIAVNDTNSSNTPNGFYSVANNTGFSSTTVRPSRDMDNSFNGVNTSSYPVYTGGGELIVTGRATPTLLPNQGSLVFTSFAPSDPNGQTHYSAISAVTNTGHIYSWGNTVGTGVGYALLGDGASISSNALISSISQANPAVVTTNSNHNLVAGDTIFIHSLPGMAQLGRGLYKVGTVLSPTTFELQDSGGTAVNSSSFSATSGLGSYNKVPTGCYSQGTYVLPCSYTPVQPAGGHTVASGKMVSFGGYYLRSFITSAGAIKSWGTNYVGDRTTNTRSTPVDVRNSSNATLTNVFTRLYPTGDMSCAIDTSDDAYCWGYYVSGMRGNGVNADRSYVTPISGGLKWLTLSRIQPNAVMCGLTTVATACPAPTACGDETIYWGNGCAAQTSTRSEGVTTSINNQAPSRSGSIDITCNAGTYNVSNATCIATNCPAETVTWGGSCSRSIGVQNNGDSTGSVANTAPGYTGSATITCTNGVNVVSGSSCNQDCIGQTVNWGSCSGTAGAANHGAPTAVVSNTNSGFTGNVTVQCNNGTFNQSSATCNPAPANCPAQVVNWGNCSANTGGTINHGNSGPVTNSTSGYTGTATASCTNGTLSASGTCNQHCAARSETWGSCAGSTPAINHGNNSSVSNTNGGFTGAVTMSCTNGTLSQSSASCTPVAPSCSGGNAYGQYVNAMDCGVEQDASETCCTSPDVILYRDHSQNVGSCGLMNWTSVSCGAKYANGQPSYGHPSNCLNGDSDGNGTCGTQGGGSCSPAQRALFASICPEFSNNNVTDGESQTVQGCSSCEDNSLTAICQNDTWHSEYGNWDETLMVETAMYYNGSTASWAPGPNNEHRIHTCQGAQAGNCGGAGSTETGNVNISSTNFCQATNGQCPTSPDIYNQACILGRQENIGFSCYGGAEYSEWYCRGLNGGTDATCAGSGYPCAS